MHFIRTITKTGIEAQGGLEIPSPFVFEYEFTDIDVANNVVHYRGSFKKEEDGEAIPLHRDNVPCISFINGNVTGAYSISEDGFVHTIDETLLNTSIDADIVQNLSGIALEDIS